MKAIGVIKKLLVIISVSFLFACNDQANFPLLDNHQLADTYFKEDAQWYLDNIPFFECSDKQLEAVYYYRWKLYKAHIRNVGANEYVITEFINHVSWDRDPYCTINAASMHHIYEGRWLKDDRYMDGYINNLYQHGGNNRKYSESIADAAYARYLVNADAAFLSTQLDSMKYIYEQWYDHWDSSKQLYYIPAMPDATEYTIASIDASGGKDGFEDGEAFRPTINSYMYANALAIANTAKLKGDNATADVYLKRAATLKANAEQYLWNDSLQHFTDRFKVDNQYVHYWNFIRGRELAGLIPWYFELPSDSSVFNTAWKHIIDTSQLLGKFGFRTNEPSYQYYFKQFLYYMGQRGSQWNGPGWPYQTSLVLTGLANFINDYKQDIVTSDDYVRLLRLYARQHYLPNGKLDLVENYDPNLGGPIVYYYWSNHYNHSSFNNLIITGLCGIRPSASDTLVINPITDSSIKYFCLDDMAYHGHKLSVVYDEDGNKYKYGKGLTVFIDGKKATFLKTEDSKDKVVIGKPVISLSQPQQTNYALNIDQKGYPVPSASVNAADTSLYQVIDGRIWFFPEITNRWTTMGSTSDSDWLALDFGEPREISTIKIYPVAYDTAVSAPESFRIQYSENSKWLPAKIKSQQHEKPISNTVNTLMLEKIITDKIKISFNHPTSQVAISEIECY